MLFRSDGKVRYIRLRPSVQVAAVALLAAFVAWGVGSSMTVVVQDRVIEARNAEIEEARIAYYDLRTDLVDYRAAVAKLVHTAGGRDRDAADLEVVTAALQDAIGRLSTDLDLSADDRNRIIASRTALHDQIASLKAAIRDGERREGRFAAEVSSLKTRMESILHDRAKTVEERDGLRAQVAALRTDLRESRSSAVHLEDRLARVLTAAEAVRAERDRIARQRTQLEGRVADLSGALAQARTRGDRLGADLADHRTQLAAARDAQRRAENRRAMMEMQAAGLDQELAEARESAREMEARVGAVVEAMAAAIDAPPAGAIAAGARSLPDRLDAVTAILVAELERSRYYAKDADDAIREILTGLEEVAGAAAMLMDRRDAGIPVTLASGAEDDLSNGSSPSSPELARQLLAQMQHLHRTQKDVVEALVAQTETNVVEAERMLGMTGLSWPDVLAMSGLADGGQGGPFHPLGFDGGTSQELQGAVAYLQEKQERWAKLRELMACVPWISPVDYYHLTSRFGKRRDPISGRMSLHAGVDLAAWPRTPVYATAPGHVTFAGRDGGYGRMVEIDHGCGIVTRYAHLRSIAVEAGQEVQHRDRIGTVGTSGRSTGPHVHYEIRVNGEPIDPDLFIEAGRHVFKG